MILHLKKTTNPTRIQEIVKELDAFHIITNDTNVLITESALKTVPSSVEKEIQKKES